MSNDSIQSKSSVHCGFIHDDLIALRKTTPNDLSFVVELETAPENAIWIRQWDRTTHLQSLHQGDIRHLIVETIDDSRPVGFVILRGLTAGQHSIELKRIAIAEKGRGFGRSVVRLLKQLVFDELRSSEFWLEVIPNNKIARELYINEGFKSIGWNRESGESPPFDVLEVLAIRNKT